MALAAGDRAAQAFEGLRQRQPLRRHRRPPGPGHRGDDAQRGVDGRRRCAPLQLRRDARKVTAAQIAAQQLQPERRQPGSERDAGQAAGRAQHDRFGQHQRAPLPRCQAEHAEQRELLRAPRHAQRQHREHQEAAGEQRHQRQHGEVDAVGARQIADPLGGVARRRRRDAGGQLQRAQPGIAIGTGAQAHVNPGQLADAAEQVLRGGDVHHRQRRTASDHRSGDPGVAQFQPALQPHDAAGGQLLRRRIEKDGGRRQQRQPVGADRGLRHQRRRHRGDHQRVDSHHPQGLPLAAVQRPQGAQFQHRTGDRDGGIGADPLEQAFVERPLRGAQFQIRLAVDRAHRAGELAQRRRIDELD